MSTAAIAVTVAAGGEKAEDAQIHMHFRFRQDVGSIAEVEAAAGDGFAFEQGFKARRADLFAVGVMLWEIVAGHRMHRGEQQLTILQELFTGEFPKAAQASADVPPRLAAIIDKALAEKPEERFSSAAELARALESVADELGDKAGVRELGALVAAHFAADREKVAAIVEEQLKLAPEQINALPMIDNTHKKTNHFVLAVEIVCKCTKVMFKIIENIINEATRVMAELCAA